MQSLDDRDRSWVSLVAELRVHARKVLEPLSIKLDFESEISDNAAEPNGAIYLNLLRICAEALTNIIKHSEADEVAVSIAVSDTMVKLGIRDNGRGFTPGEANGRGVRGMQTRAGAIGGGFSIRSSDGTSVCLEIPWRRAVPL